MGITGLLPFVEKASKKCNLSEFKGRTFAIDTYCLLHKGSYGCAEKLVLGEDTNVHILYCMKYVKMLLNYRIKPILVFDGRHLPAKLETEKKRRDNRKAAKIRAAEFLRLGKTEDARLYFRKAVDITHSMAFQLIKECRNINVDCIVAPYEADAQLAFLSIENIADVVVTEDSDLLTFGCKKVLFKLDLSGNGTLVDTDKLYIPMQMRQDNYSFEKFQLMCILSGCDYLESLPGIGLKKSHKFVTTTANPDIFNSLAKIPAYLNMKQLKVPDEYRTKFMTALATFRHQVVFDPITRKSVHLTSKEVNGTDEEYCINTGEIIPDDVAFQLALGNLDPFSLKTLDNWNPESNNDPFSRSIWSKNYKKNTVKLDITKYDTEKVDFHCTKGKSVTIDAEKLLKRTEERDETVKQEYDDKIMREIKMMYESPVEPPMKKQKIESEDKTEIQVSDEDLSPVLTRKSYNSFIVSKESQKNLSKLPKTDIAVNKIVKSRFFNSKLQECGNDTSNILNVSLLGSIDNRVNKCETKKIVEGPSDLENSTPPPESKDLELQNKSEELKVEMTLETAKQKLAKFQSNRNCRRPGLNKNGAPKLRTIDKNQPSVLSMFQNMNK